VWEIIPFICAAIFFCIGIFMAIAAKTATKKDFRQSTAAVKKTRRNGIIIVLLSFIMAGLGAVQWFFLQ